MFCEKCGKPLADGNRFCEFCGAPVAPAPVKKETPATAKKETPSHVKKDAPSHVKNEAPAAALTAAGEQDGNPRLALFAAGLLTLLWMVSYILTELFIGRLVYSGLTLICLCAGVLGASVYLVSRRETDYRIFGFGFALLTAVMLFMSEMLVSQASMMKPGIMFFSFFGENRFRVQAPNLFLTVLLCAAAALLISMLSKKEGVKKIMLAGGVSGAVFFVIRSLYRMKYYINVLSHANAQTKRMLLEAITSKLPTNLTAGITIFCVAVAVWYLCSMKDSEVRLSGFWKVWAWLGLIGGISTAGMLIYAAMLDVHHAFRLNLYSYHITFAVCAVAGYLMLLRKDRKGLYVILIGIGICVIAQLFGALSVLRYGLSGGLFKRLLAALTSAVNPLFAWLGVRDADLKNPAAQGAASPAPAKAAAAPAAAPAEKPEKKKKSSEKIYYESDNMGTRQDTVELANAYWLVERFGQSVKPPFTLYTLPSKDAAEQALLEMPFIHRAADSGKLICDRLMTFGCYETTLNGIPTGEYEALITGRDFTLEEFRMAEDAFKRHGGRLKNHDEPSPLVKAGKAKGSASKVKYRETRTENGMYTYEIYSAPDKASAMEFLKGKPVTKRLYYIIVDTPEGGFGRDIDGIYQM